jgi:hypothetical protein
MSQKVFDVFRELLLAQYLIALSIAGIGIALLVVLIQASDRHRKT